MRLCHGFGRRRSLLARDGASATVPAALQMRKQGGQAKVAQQRIALIFLGVARVTGRGGGLLCARSGTLAQLREEFVQRTRCHWLRRVPWRRHDQAEPRQTATRGGRLVLRRREAQRRIRRRIRCGCCRTDIRRRA